MPKLLPLSPVIHGSGALDSHSPHGFCRALSASRYLVARARQQLLRRPVVISPHLPNSELYFGKIWALLVHWLAAFSLLAILSCYLMPTLGNILKWENRSVAWKASLFCSTRTTPLHSDSIIFQSHHVDLCALNRYVSFPPLSFQTELIDLSTVDVILISNYHCMMALPYITEHTGFTGTVYATEPTVQIGRWEYLFSQQKVAEELLPSLVTI